MTIFKSCFDTYIGRRMHTGQLTVDLAALEVSSKTLSNNTFSHRGFALNRTIASHDGALVPTIVTPASSAEQALPVFYHPVQVREGSIKGVKFGNYLVADARSFMRVSRAARPGGYEPNQGVEISNTMEFELLQARLGLEAIWINQGPATLRYISGALQSIYATWIAQNIRRRFNLDMGDQMRLQVLASLFYHCLFLAEDKIDDNEINRLAVTVAKYAKAPVEEAITIITQVGHIAGVEDFVNKVRAVLDNPRLENFNVDVLMTIMAATWFGLGGREIAAIAVEHPPTFIAITYLAFAQRGYRNAGLTTVTDAFKGAKGEADIVRGVSRLIYE